MIMMLAVVVVVVGGEDNLVCMRTCRRHAHVIVRTHVRVSHMLLLHI